MSRAVVGELVTDVKVGDVAEVFVVGAAPPAPPTSPAPQGPAIERSGSAGPRSAPEGERGESIDPQTAEVLALFADQAGKSVDVRIASWERFLSTRPGSPFAEAIRRDLDALRELREELRPPSVARDSETLASVQHNPLGVAPAGAAIPVVFVIDQPEHVASAYLHYRPHGARTYRSLLLAREHDIYLRGVLPAEWVQAPGIDYFVEVSTPAGRSGLALGSPEAPIAVGVAGPPIIERFASAPGRSSVKLAGEYLDFATFDQRTGGDHKDRLVDVNVDFTYRLDHTVESVGVGYGVLVGSGGYADRTWTVDQPMPRAGFDYGYVDAEVGGHTDGHLHLSVGGQLIAGVGRAGFGLGGEGRFRIGDRDRTNLMISARTIDQVGWLSQVRFGTPLAHAVRFGVSVAATDQPNDGDIGVKLGTDVEVLGGGRTSLLMRASWQGRSVAHGGLGGGAGLGVYW
jgi:hypothetical protein